MVNRALRDHREIALVLGLYIALGLAFSATTPLFEAPDEQWHFAYVQYVATQHGLPVQTLGTPQHLARQEGSQPPLYYLLAAAVTGWIDTSDFPGMIWENPHYGYDIPGVVNDNKNLFIHTSLESFPYRGAALAIHVARALSVLIGALAVLFTYLLTLEIFPDRKFLAASAAGVMAFIPQFLFVSGAVSNDSTIVAMAALSLWMTIRLLIVRPTARAAIMVGAATGLAALAKVSGVGLVALAGLVLVYALRAERKRLAVYLLLFGAAVLAVAGGWYLRNWMLYGELTGTEMMVRIFGARQAPLSAVQWVAQLSEVWETFWVGFGWGNIRATPVVYATLAALVGVAGSGLVLGLVKRRKRLHVTFVKALPFLVLAAWIVLAFGELVRWMDTTQAPHGRLLFPVLPALAPLAVYGLTQWVPLRLQPAAARFLAVDLFLIGLLAPFAILQPAYAFPPFVTVGDLPSSAHRVDLDYDHQMRLIAYEMTPDRARPNSAVELTLYWQALTSMNDDYSIGIHLQAAGGREIGARNSYPGHGLLPTRLWRVGQVLRDTYWVPVAADAPAPAVADLSVALYSRADKRDLTAFDPSGKAVTPIVGRVKVAAAQPETPRPQRALTYRLGKEIELVGYSGSDSLTLYWKRTAPIGADYTVFVHLFDDRGNRVAQVDQQPADGASPTSLWDEGEIVVDTYPFGSLRRGAYRVQVGMYLAESGTRLAVSDGTGKAMGDYIELGQVEIGH